MHYSPYFLFTGISLLLTGCDSVLFSATDTPAETTLLTGECLNSTELKFDYSTCFNIHDYYGPLSFVFGFELDLEQTIEQEQLYPFDYRYVPSTSIMDAFGENRGRVQEDYETMYREVKHGNGDFRLVTIFYEDGASLIANKDFAGHPKGENLSPYCNWRFMLYPRKEISIPTNKDLEYPSLLNTRGGIYFPVGNYTIVEEDVSFTLTIPVRVGMYLTWINNRISNPDAEIPYYDDVLHCSFTIGKSLR